MLCFALLCFAWCFAGCTSNCDALLEIQICCHHSSFPTFLPCSPWLKWQHSIALIRSIKAVFTLLSCLRQRACIYSWDPTYLPTYHTYIPTPASFGSNLLVFRTKSTVTIYTGSCRVNQLLPLSRWTARSSSSSNSITARPMASTSTSNHQAHHTAEPTLSCMLTIPKKEVTWIRPL